MKGKMDKIEEVLTRGVDKIYPSAKALEKVLRSGKKIKLYQGFDPSMENLHLGNMVGALKLKQFQDLGHEVIFLVGDFTGMIGDPTDKSSTRPQLTRKQVLKNSKKWQSQAGKVLSFAGKNPAKIMFNSQWGDKITFKELIEITSNFTVQQMLERDFFQRRLKKGKPIHLHEFLYPAAQAIDCVKMDVDLEIGGRDQTFNMLAGRTLMKALKGKEKLVLTTRLLVDSKGEKVGKTTGNALFLNTSPDEMYGGIMSFPDEVIPLAFEMLTLIPLQSIKEKEKGLSSGKIHPMELKKQLAFEIIKMYHGKKAAQKAQNYFSQVFQKRKLPATIKPIKINQAYVNIRHPVANILFDLKLVPSKSESKRLISQGAVELNNQKIKNPRLMMKLKEGDVFKVGKRTIRQVKIK
ncbi:MAG TPA: tyrosine--tRNA ligase [Candidatus Bathyarchaeia archaeon]|nr:tyrosine--tRNA ligase [Candidatus Bathyarchaeia archaeon]